MALNGSRGSIPTIKTELDKVRRILASATSTSEYALDAKLAEYVFFPIAQLLKVSQKLSINSLELCLQCIAILIDKGWRKDIPSNLAAQLVILCSLLAEKNPKGLSFSESTDDLQAWAFWCMYHLFSVISATSESAQLLRTEANFPQLGQTISTTLDGIHDSGSIEVQVAATNALHALVANVMDSEIQASFLPGIVSKLTRTLTPQTKSRRNHTVLIGNLNTFKMLMRNTMGDVLDHSIQNKKTNGTNGIYNTKSLIDAKWQSAAAAQMKPALSNILRLKSHSRNDVLEAVTSLCLVILEHCQKALENCSQMALESLIVLAADRPDSAFTKDLQMLMQGNAHNCILLQNQLYDWLQNLPTIAQGSDEQLKIAKLEQISMAYKLLKAAGINMDTIETMLSSTLRDCVTVALTTSIPSLDKPMIKDSIHSVDISVVKGGATDTRFSTPLVKYRGQEEFFALIEKLVEAMSSSSASPVLADSQIRLLQKSQGDVRLANMWLLLTSVKHLRLQNHSFDDLLDMETDSPLALQECLEELYSFSLAILSDSSVEHQDPRLQSLALQALALRAQEAGVEFRYELVDALYPVLHTLATPNTQLQNDSIAALNIFSSACGYSSVEQLVVENVDYLTNAVALKLNAFDVSPQAPQVLLMMVKLSGPSLLPYLEDTVDSIFAALENYHGYPLLVELLFQVLSVVAEEGAKTPQLAIAAAGHQNEKTMDHWSPTTMESLTAMLREKTARRIDNGMSVNGSMETHPQVPWQEISKMNEQDSNAHGDQSEDVKMDDSEALPPVPKTYNLLLKINELTQHFLPSSSPSLRIRLLSLIKTTVPALAQHEDSFLPLINTLWPEIVSRLDDEEQYIVAAALDVVAMLCQYAGDFMRTRIAQVWPRLKEIHMTVANDVLTSVSSKPSQALEPVRLKKALLQMQASPSTFGDTGAKLLLSSITFTLTVIVRYTSVSPEMFDEALEMSEAMLEEPEVHSAFAHTNADAVWLYDLRGGCITPPSRPFSTQDVPWKFASVQG